MPSADERRAGAQQVTQTPADGCDRQHDRGQPAGGARDRRSWPAAAIETPNSRAISGRIGDSTSIAACDANRQRKRTGLGRPSWPSRAMATANRSGAQGGRRMVKSGSVEVAWARLPGTMPDYAIVNLLDMEDTVQGRVPGLEGRFSRKHLGSRDIGVSHWRSRRTRATPSATATASRRRPTSSSPAPGAYGSTTRSATSASGTSSASGRPSCAPSRPGRTGST